MMVSDLLLSTPAALSQGGDSPESEDSESKPGPSGRREGVSGHEDSAASRQAGSVGGGASARQAHEAPDEPLTLEAVYTAHFRFVWRCLRNLGVGDVALDDAVQEVFLVVDRKLPHFSGSLRPWLYAIVRRIALRHRQRAQREASRFVSENALSPGFSEKKAPDLREEVDQRERLEIAFRALDQLDHNKREVFVFCLIEGLSAPEVAQIVGVPQNTVYSRLSAARREFSVIIERLQKTKGAVAVPRAEPEERAISSSGTQRRKP